MAKLTIGKNDLLTMAPEIAAQLLDVDPSTISYGSSSIYRWQCSEGHIWATEVYNRTSKKCNCPTCGRRRVKPGVNDLLSCFPLVAAEADGWDPSIVTRASNKKLPWVCEHGHKWITTPGKRTIEGTGCPTCAGNILSPGVNDLLTRFPEVAKEADGWDPATVSCKASVHRNWKCLVCDHRWTAYVNNRTHQGNGCPKCAATGYKVTKSGFMYLLYKNSEQKIGITNSPESRLKKHEQKGWTVLEIIGPMSGQEALDRENTIKRWLKKHGYTLEGTQENWRTDSLEVLTIEKLEELITGH